MSRQFSRLGRKLLLSSILMVIGGVSSSSSAFAATACETSPPAGGTVSSWLSIINPRSNQFDATISSGYTSYSFNAPSSIYECTSNPKIGITVSGNSNPDGSNLKEVAISPCPGDFSVPSGCLARVSGGSVNFTNSSCSNLALDTNTSGPASDRHKLYLNIRPVAPAASASATISSTDFGCTPGASNTRINGSQLSNARAVGAVASNNPTEKVSLPFSPYVGGAPYGLVCPPGTLYQIKLERAFPSLANFSSMDVTLSLSEFDIAGGSAAPTCKVSVPMSEAIKTITLPPARDITWEICRMEEATTCSESGCSSVSYKVCGPRPPLESPVGSGICNLSTNYYFDENENYIRPTYYLNVASHGPNASAVNITGQCVPVASTLPTPPPPPIPGVPPLPGFCAADPVPVKPLNGLGRSSTVNSTGILSASHQSFAFTSPGSPHSCGVRFHFAADTDLVPEHTMKEVTISTCPNVYAPPAGHEACHIILNDDTTFDLNTPYSGMCSFPAGTQLYMNIRPWPDVTGGRTALKFTSEWLDGTCTPPTPTVAPTFPHVSPTALAPLAVAIAGCAPDIMSAMRDNGQQTVTNLDTLVGTLIKPAQPAGSSNCMRNLFNVWDTDSLTSGAVAGAISSYVSSIFPFSSIMPGITLTGSSPYAPIMSLVNTMLSSSLDKLVCTDLWKGIAQASTKINLNGDGSFSFDVPSMPSLGAGGEITIP